jgi:hypothetical protein
MTMPSERIRHQPHIRIFGLLLTLVLAPGACRTAVTDHSENTKRTLMDEQLEKAIEANTATAQLVVVCVVKFVGTPPGIWSGLIATYQEVHYEPIQYIKGQSREDGFLKVFHPIVAKSKTTASERPQLRDSLIYQGAQLIVFIRERASRLETFDENYGILPSDPDTLAVVTRASRG